MGSSRSSASEGSAREPRAGAELDIEFRCTLPNGLHARPASLLSEIAARFAADVELINGRTGAAANAKSVLELVANDVQLGDRCRIASRGRDADAAHAALRAFVDQVLPVCDEALAETPSGAPRALPRVLRDSGAKFHAGTVVCPGIGRGVLVSADGLVLPVELLEEPALARSEEEARVQRALVAVHAALNAQLESHRAKLEADILRAHLSIAADVGLIEKIREHVAAGESAGRAIVAAAEFYAERLRQSGSAYVRERVADVQDVGLQLLEAIYGERVRTDEIRLEARSVLAAENLTPRQLLALDKELLAGLVLEHAGATSHAVILARSFGIPTLTGVHRVRNALVAGVEVVVDANHGVVVPAELPAVRRFYEREERALRRRRELLACRAHHAAHTLDGQSLEVAANVATAQEIEPSFAAGADGIGLFRTEMLFVERTQAPSEEEQFAVYAQAARAAGDRPVIIRTFDVGGDKPVPYLQIGDEENPALGLRGVRVYPTQPGVFRTQLRAILRASAHGRVWLMVPMVSALDEVRWVKARLAEVCAELARERIPHDPALRFGVMIEVPALAAMIDRVAPEVDFFSLGTNDLAQYFFAVDRGDRRVAPLSSARHPAFLRLLDRIVRDCRAHGKWIGMCGEMARSPRNLPLLVGLGLDEISTAAPEIAGLKSMIASFSAAGCRDLLARTLDCSSVEEVESAVAAFRARGGARGLIEPALVSTDSDSATKAEAIREIVNAFYVAGRAEDPLQIEEAVWAREAVYSTGLGHGFAIPHCKTDAITTSSIGVARLAQPIEWGSMDEKPVSCVILLCMRATDEEGMHMRVFSTLARRLMHAEFRERLMSAADCDTLLAALANELGLEVTAG
jgi:phosphoenolpyruvate-protein phosphotransferase